MALVVKRLLRSLIKSHLRPYLLYDLTIDQLSQAEGGFQLSGLDLNPKALDKFLPPSLQVISGTLCISVDIPTLINEQKLHISLNDLELVIGKGNDENIDIPVDNEDHISANNDTSIENSTYDLGGVKLVAKSVETLLNEVEVDITNLTLELQTHEFGKQISIVTHVPTLHVTHIPSETEPLPTFSKSIALPDDFTIALHELEPGASSGTKTVLIDGPTFFGSEKLSPTLIKAIFSEQSSALHIRLEVLLRSLRVALDTPTMKILSQLFKLFSGIDSTNEENISDVETEDDEAEYFSAKEDENFDDFEDSDYLSPLDDDMFEDCIDSGCENFFQSFLKNPAPIKKRASYDINLSVKQATFTLVHKINPKATAHVFSRPFDVNRLTVPPYTPYDHTTFYIADLEASLVQLPTALNCNLRIQTCGATQYLFPENDISKEDWWKSEYSTKLQLLHFHPRIRLQESQEVIPIQCKIKIDEKLLSSSTTSVDLLLSEISIGIDDQLLHRFSPFLNLLSDFIQSSNSQSPNVSVPLSTSLRNETDEEILSSSTTFHLTADALSLRIHSSTNDMHSVLFDLEDLDVYSSALSHATAREWSITVNKIIGSLDRGNNITAIFSSNKYFTNTDQPVNPLITVQTWDRTHLYQKETTPQPEPETPTLSQNVNVMDDYDSQQVGPFNFEDNETIPYPLVRNDKKLFEGKIRNPTIAKDEDLEDFFFQANSEASTKVVIRLPKSTIELAKENYDLLLQFFSEFMNNFNKNNSNESSSKSNTISNNSLVCELSVGEGTFVLREKVALCESNEEEVLSSFNGSFLNFGAFFVSNYNHSGSAYFHSFFDSFEMRDCAPHHKKPLQLLQQPKYSSLREARMCSIAGKFSPEETTVLLSLSDISVQYNLGENWTSRITNFFNIEEKHNKTIPLEVVEPQESQYPLSVYINLSNITVDYLPWKSSSAAVFLLKEAEAEFIPLSPNNRLELRCKPSIYIIDNLKHIATLSESHTRELDRHSYLEALGFRSVGEMPFCPIIIELKSIDKNSCIHIILENNEAELHLCRDSYNVLLHLYGDYANFSDSSGKTSNPMSPSASFVGDYDDSSFFDTTEETKIDLLQNTMEDYNPSSDNLSHDDTTTTSKKESEENSMIPTEVISNESNDNTSKPKVNSFDNQVDSIYDNLPIENDDNPFGTVQLPESIDIKEGTEYMVIGINDAKDLPPGAILLDNDELIDEDSDDSDFVLGQKSTVNSSPLQFSSNSLGSSDEFITFATSGSSKYHDEIADFELMNPTEERAPIVRIRSDLVSALKSRDNPKDVDGLPPMLGVNIIPQYVSKRKIENLLDLPDKYPIPSMQITLIEWIINITIHDGLHWTSSRENTQSEKNKVGITLKKLTVQLYSFSDEKLSFRIGISIGDLEIVDQLEVSNRNMLLCYDTNHLRTTNSAMLNILIQQSTSINNSPQRALLNVKTLPLRLNIDQDARYFLMDFLSEPFPEMPKSSTIWDIYLSDIYLHLDYKAKRLDRDPLNWCSLYGAKFRFNGIVKQDTTDFSGVISDLASEKWNLIRDYGLGLGPLSSIVNLGTGLTNLFYQPYSQYQKNGRIFRGVKKGVTDFGVSLGSETLNITSKVASGTQMVFEFTDDCLNMLRPDSVKTTTENTSRYVRPENYQEGMNEGLNSLKRESKLAYKHLFLIPKEEFKNGVGSCANAVVHGLPIAVLRPLIGLAEGAKHIGVGAKNQITTQDTNRIYKNK